MTIACISLSETGAAVIDRLRKQLRLPGNPRIDVYLHDGVPAQWKGKRFSRVVSLTKKIFARYRGLVFVAPCGVVVRAVAPLIEHKTTDPAVVAVDIGARWAISLLSGHEGGANELAIAVANSLGAEPVVTTSSEAVKRLIVGIGCRKGVPAERIVDAVRDALSRIGHGIGGVRLLATADVKAKEPGIAEAAHVLDVPLRIISSEEIVKTRGRCSRSSFVEKNVGLPAVAEPSALLAGRRTILRLPKTAYQGIAVAIAEESCT